MQFSEEKRVKRLRHYAKQRGLVLFRLGELFAVVDVQTIGAPDFELDFSLSLESAEKRVARRKKPREQFRSVPEPLGSFLTPKRSPSRRAP